MATSPLVGTWRLRSFHSEIVDGRTIYPYGPEVVGYITYTEDGRVAVAIASADRAGHATADFRGGTDAQKVAAYDSYISYAGAYEVEDDLVTHHVEVCLFPSWVGTDLVRLFEVAGGRLTLKTAPFLLDGVVQTSYLVWERVSPAR